MFGRGLTSLALLALIGATPPAPERPAASKDIAEACGTRDGWSEPAPPAHIFGNAWYVGTCGITVVLVETSAGLVLIDSGPEDAAPLVLANVRALGFEPRQIKWLLSTHEHFDHAGGFAVLEKATGAKLAVGPFSAQALRTGRPYADDPQAKVLAGHPMSPARVDKVLPNMGKLSLGGTSFTAYRTPTHSPGSTSWTWHACEQDKCVTIAFADSVSTISSDDYRFTEHADRLLQAGIGLVIIERLPCDIIVTPHPGASNLLNRLSGLAPLIDSGACRAYAQKGRAQFYERLAKERAAK